MGFQQAVEVFCLKFCQTLVLKIYKENFVPVFSFCLELAYTLIEHVRLACMAHTYNDIVAIGFKFDGTVNYFRFVYLSLFVHQTLLDDVLADAHHLNFSL